MSRLPRDEVIGSHQIAAARPRVISTQILSHTGRFNSQYHHQDTIYYKWASVKMTLKFHFLWSTLFWLEESVSAVYSDWLRGKSEANSCSWSVKTTLGITPSKFVFKGVDRKIEHLAVTIFWHLFWTSIVMTCVTCHVTIKYTGVRVTQETLHMGPVTCHLSPHVCEVFVWAEKWLPCPWLPPRTNQIMCWYSEWLEARGGGI